MTDEANELKGLLREANRKASAAESALSELKRRRIPLAGWSAAGGFLLFAIGGQWFPGYQLDSTAEAAATKLTESAVGEVMAELCAERFLRTAGLESRLTELNNASGDWSKAQFIRKGAWAATPDGEQSNHATAEKCRVLIAARLEESSERSS